MTDFPLTLTRHLLKEQTVAAPTPGDLSRVLLQIAVVGKILSQDLSRAGLAGLLGSTGRMNIQGEVVQKLDEAANEAFVRAFEYDGDLVKAIISEEMDKPWEIRDAAGSGWPKYAVFIDPLDGSSNLDGNMTVGSIFSIHRLNGTKPRWQDELLKRGTDQVAAGYMLYGPSTMLVYTAGQGVHQFTLDPTIGEFVLTDTRPRMPEQGKIYSANEGNYQRWEEPVQRFVEYLRDRGPSGTRAYSTRYSGCLVADVHRLLKTGGVYLYPGERGKPQGKLRLMYEAAPLAFIVEQVGGMASTGTQRILDVEPEIVHQRVPLYIGSREEIGLVESFIQGTAAVAAPRT